MENSLPHGWNRCKIGEICKINQRDKRLPNLPDELPVTFVPMSAVNADSGTIASPQEKQLGSVRKGYTQFSNGDVLFAKITPCMENGKAAIAKDLLSGLGFGSTEFHVLTPLQYVLPDWVYYYLRQESFRQDAKASFTGTAGQLRVAASFLENYEIPVPPVEEQREIIKKIEELFSDLDAGVSALKRVQANLKRYKASVLKAACEGRLVPTEAELARREDRPYESGADLLRRILHERREKWAAEQRSRGKDPAKMKYEEPRGPESENLPELPEGWCWARFDQLMFSLKNGFFSGTPSSEPPGVPILRISAVRPRSLNIDSLRYVRDIDLRKIQEYKIENGDLLFTRYNGSLDLVGACALVRNIGSDMIYPDKLIRVKLLNELICPEYVEAYFATQVARTFIKQKIKSTAGQIGIAGSDLKEIPVPLPPLAEQQRIIYELDTKQPIVDQLEKVLQDSHKRSEVTRQSILKRAFEGRL